MTKPSCSDVQFLKSVEQHEMTVIHDDGIHRHLHFSKPDSKNHAFNIITWPGALCIDGGMGVYVFRRLNDMFDFFRPEDGHLKINEDYWAEKLVSSAMYKGHKEFNEVRFKQRIKDCYEEWAADCSPSTDEMVVIQDDLNECFFSRSFENLHDAVAAYRSFPSATDIDFELPEIGEFEFEEYTSQYLWCCYAIVWGIKQYDELKKGVRQ